MPYNVAKTDPSYPFCIWAYSTYVRKRVRDINRKARDMIKKKYPHVAIISDDPPDSGPRLSHAIEYWHDYADTMRAVRTDRYKYIRNFMAEEPFRPAGDIAGGSAWEAILKMRDDGTLAPPFSRFFADASRPREELYDIKNDPDEFNNLAERPQYEGILTMLKGKLRAWMKDTGDKPALIERL